MPELEEDLIKELEKLGWKKAYLTGHGDDEPVSSGNEVVGDIEKTEVLVPPSALFDKPITMSKYYGY